MLKVRGEKARAIREWVWVGVRVCFAFPVDRVRKNFRRRVYRTSESPLFLFPSLARVARDNIIVEYYTKPVGPYLTNLSGKRTGEILSKSRFIRLVNR